MRLQNYIGPLRLSGVRIPNARVMINHRDHQLLSLYLSSPYHCIITRGATKTLGGLGFRGGVLGIIILCIYNRNDRAT